MQFIPTKTGLAVTAALLASFSVSSNEPIEIISVLGARLPVSVAQLGASVSVIERAQIENSGAINVADLLRSQAGVHISQDGVKGAQTQLRLRGSEANHVLVLVDGVEINDLNDGAVNFAHLNLANVQRIEILRGPQSALWGSGAVGGVINISTRSGKNGYAGGGEAEWGQNASQRLAASLRGGTDQINFALAASHFSTDGENISRQGDERDGTRNNELSASLNWQVGDENEIKAQYRHLDFFNQFDGTDFVTGLPADADSFTHGQQGSGKLEWHYRPVGSDWSQAVGMHYSRNQSENFTPGFDAQSAYDVTEVDSDKQRWFWQNSLNYAPGSQASLVFEHVSESFEQVGQAAPWGDPNQQQDNDSQSAVADLVHRLGRDVSINASLRYDDNDLFDDAMTYRLGLSYQLLSSLSLFVSQGKAIKNPTFIERFGYTPTSFIGNPDLEPEQSVSTELGARLQLPGGWQSSLSVYQAELEDEINGYYFDPALGGPTAINIEGESERRGLEWQVSGRFYDLQLAFNYNYLDAREGEGELATPEVRRARHGADLTLNYVFMDDMANLYLQANYQGTREDDFFPPPTYARTRVDLGAVTVINATFNYRWDQHWQLTVRAENLFDEEYEEVLGYRRQGRTAYLGASYQF
ncbi:TonB-dependent receptor domain-containing protein [Bowmanella dokdonensis]|uniref:TonB-dependent receptor n=1 Tax=Bowmanella dokdonensis TaxID=751969 RepID=A0A939DN72_9ALTE|nr:TonB-dependent receptor [Bowmanella dokdonensis]MBN7825742.1 TonB-dependent receptor [Bowmanella dokdonensis]